MARKLTMHVLCDRCMSEHDEEVEGIELPALKIGTMKPRLIALCGPEHRNHIEPWEALYQLVREQGQVVPEMGSAGGSVPTTVHDSDEARVQCPKGCTRTFGSRKLLAGHMRNVHGTTLSAFESEQRAASTEPVMDERTATCDECGQTFTGQRAFQGLGVHRSRKHGIPGASNIA